MFGGMNNLVTTTVIAPMLTQYQQTKMPETMPERVVHHDHDDHPQATRHTTTVGRQESRQQPKKHLHASQQTQRVRNISANDKE